MHAPIPKRPEENTPSPAPNTMDMKALATDDPARGPEDAPIVIVEYGDFSCGPTATAYNTMEKVFEDYGDKVRFVYKNLQTMGGWSTKGMVAAECAYLQDRDAFWTYYDLLFHGRMQGTINTGNIDSLVFSWSDELGLDTVAFKTCYENQEPAQEIGGDIAEAQSLGIGSTPTFIINGKLLVGAQPYESFRKVIDEELASSRSASKREIAPVQDAEGSCQTQ